MNHTDFETQLRTIAKGMDYPATPAIARAVARRLQTQPRTPSRMPVRPLILLAMILISLLAIPPVRAAVLDFIQIGVVRIFRTEPGPIPPGSPSTPMPGVTPAVTQPSLLPLLEQMAGETTLVKAQQAAGYPILLPAYPAGIGKPDRIFVQDANGPMTILIWMDPQHPDQVKMSLHFIPQGSWAVEKFSPTPIEQTSVNDHDAAWAVGPSLMMMQNGDMQISRLVDGHVLIWEQDGVTCRLETDSSLEEAVKTAESLKPIP